MLSVVILHCCACFFFFAGTFDEGDLKGWVRHLHPPLTLS